MLGLWVYAGRCYFGKKIFWDGFWDAGEDGRVLFLGDAGEDVGILFWTTIYYLISYTIS